MLIRIISLYFALILISCQKTPLRHNFSGQTMGTTYNVTLIDHSQTHTAHDWQNLIETRLTEINASYSNWDPSSEISRFNAQTSLDAIEISNGLSSMLKAAQHIHTATSGHFDLTLDPLVQIWGFGPLGRVTQRPDINTIKTAQNAVGFSRVITISNDGSQLKKNIPEAQIDLAAIAKGYGIDVLSQDLHAKGIKDFMIEIGGDLYVSGQAQRNAAWRIGIERPDPRQRQIEEIITLSNMGMATSGDYRNYFEEGGTRYSHIINPLTAQPIRHHTASVTVLADSAMHADAWATALLVLGSEKGLPIAQKEGLAALFIDYETLKLGTETVTQPVIISSAAFKSLQNKD